VSAVEEAGNRSLAGEGESAPTPLRRIVLGLVRLGIGLGLLAYLVESGTINLGALARLFTGWPFVLAAAALLLVDMGLMALRLSLLFRPHNLKLSPGSAFRLTLVSQFFSAFLPGGAGGDVVKLYYATRENRGRRTEIVTIVLFDRAIGMFSLLCLPLLIAPFFLPLLRSNPILRGLLIAGALLALALLAAGIVASSGFAARHRLVLRLLEWLPGGGHVRRIMETVRSYRHSLGTVAAAFGLGLAGNLMALASTMLVALAISPGSIAWRMSLLIPLGQVANSVPLTPGGLGVGEAAFNLLFSLGGLARGADILLGWRLVTVLVGLLGLFYYLQGLRRCVSDADSPSR
jgi:uncharacterized protein (TIRG00374 family)